MVAAIKKILKTIKKIKENLDNNYFHLEKTEFSITKNELEFIKPVFSIQDAARELIWRKEEWLKQKKKT